MSDAGNDPALSDDEVNGQATPAENAEDGTPLNTVEENGLDDDDDDDDLFGERDDAPAEDAPAEDAPA
jgi:RNA polymerase-associated protein LEO1